MFDEVSIARAVDEVMKNIERVNQAYIQKIANQINKIGQLNASSVNRITLMTEMGADIAEITNQLRAATQLTEQQMMVIYQRALDDMADDPRFSAALKHTEIKPEDTERINQYARAVSMQTAQQIENLSNTTSLMPRYKDAVDKAILAVNTGLTDYRSATRDVIRDLGTNGMQVYYESGYHRRLDTAIRQNIIDGANQIAQHCSDMMGEALGYDAVEITAHAMSAPDHEPVQGRVFLKAEFEKMQSGSDFQDVDGNHYEGFSRPIGEWNCKHFAMSFSTKHSKRKFTDEQLKQFAEANEKGCEINGKHYTRYGASQLMRRLETQIRREKDVANAAKTAGDDVLRRECQMRINSLMQKYNEVANKANLKPHRERTMVEGFRRVSVSAQTPQNATLTNNSIQSKLNLTEKLPPKESMSDEDARKWYIEHDRNIPNLIDKNASIEEQARQACDLRNYYRTTTRDLMADQVKRRELDITDPNKSFEELLVSKMERKGLTRDEAVLDVLRTATKTNAAVNKRFGLEEPS